MTPAPPAGPTSQAWGQPAPVPGQYGTPGGYAAPPAYAPPAPVGPPDPNSLGIAFARLGNAVRKNTRVAVAVAGVLLEEGETVEAIVGGKLDGNAAVLVLTDRGLVLADERQWKPFSKRMDVNPQLEVQGWQDDRTASLTLLVEGQQVVLDQIADRPLAVEMAQRIRYRTGATS